MANKSLYSIILPTYNESENLPLMIWLIDNYLNKASIKFEVVIVDDNSPDGTLKIAKKLKVLQINLLREYFRLL